MASNRAGRRPGRAGGRGGGSPGSGGSLSVGGSPRPGGSRSPGLQRRAARVTVKYNRRELQRRLDTESWIQSRLQQLYRGTEGEMPDELDIEELLELETDEERSRKIQDTLKSCTSDTQGFIQELLTQLKGLPKQQVLQQSGPRDPPP